MNMISTFSEKGYIMRIGTISYNIYCNFTNYGSALQTWALHQAIKKIGHTPVLVDYCPDVLSKMNPLNPFENMWDKDDESRKMVELSMPAIRENYNKFNRFYCDRFVRTNQKYTSQNINNIVNDESIDGFVCGSDTIFCPDEFGFDDGYYANYESMKGKAVSYAASFGDPHFTDESYGLLDERIKNFKALGIRENQMIPYLKNKTDIPVKRVLDPTLLLDGKEYEEIISERTRKKDYLLIYSRRYTPKMEKYAEKLANENGWEIIDISLRAINSESGHIMAYDAGVEEFLGLVKNAKFIVTNSFHGMIFSVQFKKQFVVFSREQCDNKIDEMLSLFGLRDRMLFTGDEKYLDIDYDHVHCNIENARNESMKFLEEEIELLKR